MTLHNYRSRQVHETLNGVNPPTSFRDMRSAKSGPNLWQIWQVFGPWASPYGANGHMTITVHTYRLRQFHRTSNGENPSSGYRDMGSASLAAIRLAAHLNAHPPTRTVTTLPLQPGGLRGKKACGIDGIPNEILKTCVPLMIEPITKLFNSILTNGLFPKQWTFQTLSPLHKKGTINNPDNHRGIAIGNGLAKIFLQVLQKRLTSFSEKNKLIPTNQIGYKKGSRTTDHILTLKNIIDKYILQIPRRYLYVCFIDF